MAQRTRSTRPATESRPGRVVIEAVEPEIDDGRFPIKRTVGEVVEVEADIHAEGHDRLAAIVLYRHSGEADWIEVRMEALPNDRWRGRFTIESLQPYEYTLEAWIDPFRTWRRDLRRRLDAGQDVATDLLIGADLVTRVAGRAAGDAARDLVAWAALLRRTGTAVEERCAAALDEERALLIDRHPDRGQATRYDRVLGVTVERPIARFGAWYEMFPRSTAALPGRHGTFRDCIERLPYVAAMGFDVLYLPPIHPIGRTLRKGPNNKERGSTGDPGSPWAIGAEEGGHRAIHPDLGTIEEFRELRRRTAEHGMELALDIAFQCSPDHPYVREHPGWFRNRPDGSIQYAENPPKKYQDIYPFDFECDDWRGLWEELKGVVLHWAGEGVRLFRVDNPHTKPYAFWEWLIREVRAAHPDVVFLSEAFTRPKVMYRLAKIGFSQSYTYFAWRNTAAEIRDYFTELTQPPVREFFRPALWPNTPDILTEQLQAGGRPAFLARLVLAATLGATYGIYGPAFELCENRPLVPGKEEYLDSEKYQVRAWDRDRVDSLAELIAILNRIRRENPALHSDRRLRFHPVSNDQLVVYSKTTGDLSNIVVTVLNLDPHHVHSGFVDLPLDDFGIEGDQPYQAHDLLSGARYVWSGARNYVELDPRAVPAHVLRIRRHLRSERDFDYYL